MRRRLTVLGGRRRWAVALVVGGLAAGVLPVSLRAASGASGAGVVSNFTDPGICAPFGITPGPDGAVWFTNCCSPTSSIGRITTAGAVSNFPGAYGVLGDITPGPDGALYYKGTGSIGRVTTSGVITRFVARHPNFLTAGPDGALWFTSI